MNGYSPVLSILTAAFELSAAVWVLRQPGRPVVLRQIAVMLVVLAGYQLCEVYVCARPEDLFRSRLAFSVIAWLPPLGLSLLATYAAPVSAWAKRGVQACYAYALLMCVVVFMDPEFVVSTVCKAMLATFYHGTWFEHAYGIWYETSLCAILIGAAVAMTRLTDKTARQHSADLQIGLLGFIIPAFLTQIVWVDLDISIPSLMCHYAIILAFFLVRTTVRERRIYGSS